MAGNTRITRKTLTQTSVILMGRVGLVLFTLTTIIGHVTEAEVTLEHLSTAYLPYTYEPEEKFGFDRGGAEKGAVDTNNNFLYTVGGDLIHVVGFDNLSSLTRPYYEVIPGTVAATDVATCGTWVAIAADNTVNTTEGKVVVYSAYTAGGSMTLIHDITVGTTPDMLIFTSNCTRILTAIEGSVTLDLAGEPYDAEGEVVIIEFNNNPEGAFTLQRADFTAFNPMADEYTSRGVRWVYRGEGMSTNNTFSQDMEPEYITFNSDESIAYIVLQENNAIATLSMTTGQITEIYPLGEKAWLDHRLDPSDRDSGVNIMPWEVYGIYQPDGFKYVSYNGQGYLITANEGDTRDDLGEPINWAEAQRGKDFFENNQIADNISIGLRDSLGDDTKLGRLDLSLVEYEGLLGDKYHKFVTYGCRSFSLFRVEANGGVGGLHYDSGSQFEQQIALEYPFVFNANHNDETENPEDSFDSRSDRSGPDPESIETGDINGKPLIFIGLERPGFIAVYSVDPQTAVPQYESLHFYGGEGDTYGNLYDDRMTRDLDPEGLRFIPAVRSPNTAPLLTVFSPITSTVSLYQVVDVPANSTVTEVPDGEHTTAGSCQLHERVNRRYTSVISCACAAALMWYTG